MDAESQSEFVDKLSRNLNSEPMRRLWRSMAQEYTRPDGGPDAAAEWLRAEQLNLQDRVERSLIQLANQIEE